MSENSAWYERYSSDPFPLSPPMWTSVTSVFSVANLFFCQQTRNFKISKEGSDTGRRRDSLNVIRTAEIDHQADRLRFVRERRS